MKLNETNSKFAVVKTAFHCGGTISFHNSLNEALKTEKENTGDCTCGCCAIVPITEESKKELVKIDYYVDESEITLYKNLPYYTGNEHYSTICK